jgi:hypothetical protein
MADPKNKLKIQKDLIVDENDLLEDQVGLFNKINKLLDKQNGSVVGIKSSLKKTINDLQTEKNLLERINQISGVNKSIQKEIVDLRAKEAHALDQANNFAKISATAMVDKFKNEAKAFRQEIRDLTATKKALSDIAVGTQRVIDLQQILANFTNTTFLNSIGITGTTGKLQNILQKIINVTGKNVQLTNSILGIFQRFEAPLLLVIFLGGQIWELFKKLDEEAFKARKEMGMMRDIHQPLRQQAEDLYKQYADLGVTVEHVYKTQKAIALELGSAHSATKAIVEQASLMSAQFGISEDTTVKMLKTLGQMNQSTAAAQTQLVGFAGTMANAAGVPLPQVMEDVAKASATTRTMFAKTPLDMIKAAVEARRLGTTLNQMSESSRKILNFTESMEAEMEASVLLGRSLNLQLARQLAYNGKIAESNKEILRLAKQLDFEHMDPFQAEAFARATGKTVDELRSMVQADRELNEIRRRANELARQGNFTLQKQLEQYEELQKANEAVAKARGEDYETMVKQRANQERLTSIANTWKQIMMEIGQVALPIIDDLLKLAVPTMKVLAASFRPVTQVLMLLRNSTAIKETLLGIGNMVRSLTKISGVGKNLLTIFKSLGKLTVVLSILFAAWNVVKAIYHGIKDIMDGNWADGLRKIFIGSLAGIIEGFLGFVIDLPILIMKGLGALGVETAKVWADAAERWWDEIKDWLGFSPSKIGLLIVKGIESIGGMLFDALMSPFKLAWDAVTKLWSGIGGVITEPLKKAWDTVQGWFGANKTVQPSVEKPAVNSKIASLAVPVDRPLTDKEIRSYKELDKVPEGESVKQTLESTEQKTDSVAAAQVAILNELKAIRQDLLDGKIAVNLDGQLVSTMMNRNNSFRGSYGSMQR